MHQVRADIQALRAIAVGSVVVAHFWPAALPGGFTGVDVFFVVSGFLITGRILRDVEVRTPAAFVAHFWAGRVRRILPAALVVLVAVLVASWVLLPESRWPGIGRDVLASALSLENWQLARQAVDYGAEGAAPSPVQHFWSLSVEEQFYLGWPVLLLTGVLLGRRLQARTGRLRVPRRVVLAVLMGVVLVASFGYSLVATGTDPAAAYFVTPTRIWQLAAGGVVALAAVRGIRALPFVGLLLIGVGFTALGTDTAYPGWAALLPTVGTCLVLLGGPTGRWSFDVISRRRPLQWLGNVSYSVYLWHWPLLVLAPAALDRDLTGLDKLLLVVLTLLLSHTSYRLVEQPFRRGTSLRFPLRSWAFGALGIAVVAAGSVGFARLGDARLEAGARYLATHAVVGGSCVGAAAIDHDCPDRFAQVGRSIAMAGAVDKPVASRKPRCSDTTGRFSRVVCHLGDRSGTKTVLLWGNSHASAWSDAFDEAGRILGWKVIVASRAACLASPVATSDESLREVTDDEENGCLLRNDWVRRTLVPQVDVVVIADLRSGLVGPGHDLAGFRRAITQARADGTTVVWMADVPLTATLHTRRDGPECLQERGQCTNAAARALATLEVTDRMQELVPDLPVIRTRDRFCDDEQCYAAIGGVSVYTDGSHLSSTFSRSLGPWLARELKTCLDHPKACTKRE